MVGGQAPCGSARQWPPHASGRVADGRTGHVGELCSFHDRLVPGPGGRSHTTQKRRTCCGPTRNVSAKGASSDQQYDPPEVQFVVPVEVNYGDCVKVVGNESALGSWDCSRAVPLQWNEGNIWTQKVDLNPGAYEFKCVVADSAGGTQWEPGRNRSIEVPPEASHMEVACEWWNTQKTSSSTAATGQLELIEKTATELLSMEASEVLGMPVERQLLDLAGALSVAEETGNGVEHPCLDAGEQEQETQNSKAEKSQQLGAELLSDVSELEKCMTDENETNTISAAVNVVSPQQCECVSKSKRASTAEALQMASSSSVGAEQPLLGLSHGNHVVAASPGLFKQKSMSLVAAGHILPHAAKRLRGGEDAYFVSTAGLGGIGVADGVGSWAQDGVDPARYPRILIGHVARALNQSEGEVSAKEALAYAQKQAVVLGSCTICVGLLREGSMMEFANLGDCGFRIIREGRVVHSSKVQQHKFNYPFQLSHPTLAPGDSAADAEVYEVPVEDGDMVLMGTDGLFHNMWDEDLGTLVQSMMEELPRTDMSARAVATAVAETAHKNALDPSFRSPLSQPSAEGQDSTGDGSGQGAAPPEGLLGGKMDDCTVVVGLIGGF